jgi:hypothetical protein
MITMEEFLGTVAKKGLLKEPFPEWVKHINVSPIIDLL